MPLRPTIAALVLSAALLTTLAAHAQSAAHQHAMPPGTNPPNMMPMDHAAHQAAMNAASPSGPSSAVPTMPGQDAFGTIQEIVRILDADPATDWSKVDIEALRQHLIDMNEVMLNARAATTPADGGARFAVTGEGRTLDAIRRMVPAHAREINGVDGWATNAEPLPDGVLLTVTAADPRQTARIRGLGFIGIMAQGSHHQMHHLAMARGGFAH
jgi:hypothetical protein